MGTTKLKVVNSHLPDEVLEMIPDDAEFGIVWEENCYRVELAIGENIMSFGPFATTEEASRWVGMPLKLWQRTRPSLV
jgi:hypothetical protein